MFVGALVQSRGGVLHVRIKPTALPAIPKKPAGAQRSRGASRVMKVISTALLEPTFCNEPLFTRCSYVKVGRLAAVCSRVRSARWGWELLLLGLLLGLFTRSASPFLLFPSLPASSPLSLSPLVPPLSLSLPSSPLSLSPRPLSLLLPSSPVPPSSPFSPPPRRLPLDPTLAH